MNEQEALAYLVDSWVYAMSDPEPESATEVLELLNRPLCIAKGKWQHFMYWTMAKLPDGPLEWHMGYCQDCLRAVLMLDDDTANTTRWWTFYDQESA
ncbi:hypothetical protein ACTXJ1_16860 [Brachybacterium alimentarium]|uniref:hypothetical protein n=1 Tax=Brachybacterium alimentarium TaxID=47845 RepID=UPI003FD6A875